MKLFQNASIQRKQTLIIMLTTTVALLLACAAFTSYEVITFRKAMVRNLFTMAEIIGDNAAASLDFNDPKTAQEILGALKDEPNVVGACIYLKNGEIFATYDRAAGGRVFTPPKFQMYGNIFGKDDLILFDPMDYKGDNIGVVCLVSDMHVLYSRLEQYALIISAVFLVALLAAFLLSARLQRLISEPILQLVQTAHAVARDKNYSLRAVKQNEDELGALIDGFNEMLTQIQARDTALETARGHLEQRVEERTRELAASQALYQSLVDQLPVGVFRKDSEGRYVFVNAWFCRLKGAPPDKFLGKTAGELSAAILAGTGALRSDTDELAALSAAHHRLIMETGRQIEVEEHYPGSLPGKDQYLHVVKSPVFGADGVIVGSQGITVDISQSKQAAQELEKVHRELVETSRQAGMAEVATSVLHNVGNVLNSVNISCSLVSEKVRGSRVANLSKAVALMKDHKHELAGFLTEDPRGKQLPGYLGNLAIHLADEQEEIIEELASLTSNIEHIKEIVAMQQSYARVSGASESLNVIDLVEDAVRMNAGALERHGVQLSREYPGAVPATVDKHKVLQILVNLIRNAKYALDEGMPAKKMMTLRVAANGDDQVKISVMDNGVGIPAENMIRIFNHGFTTRKDGHGFGLHSGALAARELGGSLTVHSDGDGKGASFVLEFPREPAKEVKS